jgi:4-amino-4-deoxy-L-arabinose transferase-like glycosyltransferase
VQFSRDKVYWGIAVSVVVLYFLLAAGTALSKRPWSDEGWFASPAYNLINNGHMGTTILESVEPRGQQKGINQYTYWVMPLDIVAQAAWYKITGFGIFQMRMLSALWGLVAAISLWFIVYRLSGNRNVALLAASIAALDYTFITGASFGRMDMMCAALNFAGFASFLLLREKHFSAAILVSQACIVASGLTHPYGALGLFGLAFLTLYLDRKRVRLRHVAFALIPYVVGAAGWGLYILQRPDLFMSQFVGNATAGGNGGGRLDGLFAPWEALYREITLRYMVAFGMGAHSAGHSSLAKLKIFMLLTYVAGIIGSVFVRSIRTNPGYRVLIFLTGIYFLLLTLFDGQKLAWYLVHTIPLFAALLAIFVHWLWTSTRMPRWAIALPLVLFAMLQLGGIAQRIRQREYQKTYLPAASFLKANAEPSSLIMGSSELAFALGFDANLVDDVRLGYYTGKQPDFIVVEEVYQDAFIGVSTQNMDVYQHILDLLGNEYRPVYDHNHYKIYARNEPAE